MLVPGTYACTNNLTSYPLDTQARLSMRAPPPATARHRPPQLATRPSHTHTTPLPTPVRLALPTWQDEIVHGKLAAYLEWAKSEPRIAGFNAWHWADHPTGDPRGVCDFKRGLVSLPKSMALMQQIGKSVGPLPTPPAGTTAFGSH